MSIDEDLERITLQERELQFDSFGPEAGWALGSLLHRLASDGRLGVVIDVSLFSMPVFFAALEGSSPDNPHWARRKRNTVFRFFKSSYAVGLALSRQQTNLQDKFALPDADYASHGGSFPIIVKGTGCIGAVTVSGLPQRADHDFVVEALCALLGKGPSQLRLAAQ